MYQAKLTVSPASPLRSALGVLRVGEEEEAERLLQRGPVGNAATQRRRIEHVAEVDGEDRHHDEPWRDVMAEELDADHLAGAAKHSGAHQRGLGDRKTVVDGDDAEQEGEGRRRHDDRKADARAGPELARGRVFRDCLG